MATAGTVGYRYLGCSGLKVSNICLGTMTFGHRKDGPVQCTETEAHALLDRFAEWGGNFIDTADSYASGESETIIGKWLAKQKRDKFVIATKVRSPMDASDINCVGLSRSWIMKEVEASLRRLQTNYVDLYQIHIWDYGTPIEETLSALNDLVHSGKVRYVGASNLAGWQLQKIVDICREKGYDKLVTLQQQYSLLARETEWELVDVCRNEGIGFLPWSPLKGGWLTGKVTRDSSDLTVGSRLQWTSAQEGRRNQSHPNYSQFANTDRVWDLLDTMATIGKQYGKTTAQVALRWLIQKDVVSSVVIGAKTLQQLDDNMGASAGWELTSEQMETLDKASAVEVPYPYEMLIRMNKGRKRP